MTDAALCCITKLVRHSSPSAAETAAFLCWAQAQAYTALAARQYRILMAQDVEEIANDYASRLLAPEFRPQWASLADEDIARLVMDDFHGCHIKGRYHP